MTIKYNIIKIKKIFQKVRELTKHSLSGDVIFVRVRITNFTVLRALPNTKPEYVCVCIYMIFLQRFFT